MQTDLLFIKQKMYVICHCAKKQVNYAQVTNYIQ